MCVTEGRCHTCLVNLLMLTGLKSWPHDMVPEDGLLCKNLFFSAGLSKLQLTFFLLSQTGSLQPNWRVNTHLLSSSSNWISKDHLLPPLQLRISFRLHFLYSFSIIYDFSLSYTKTVHGSCQLIPMQTGEAQWERFLSATCADCLAVCWVEHWSKAAQRSSEASVKCQLCSQYHS